MIYDDQFLQNAQKFATLRHAGQKYGDEFDYPIHLAAVDAVGLRFGEFDVIDRAINWLHDVREDTETSYDELVLFFGREVADAVEAMTEPKGGNRKWRHQQTYPRIRQNIRSVKAKLRDRIANVESGGKKTGMYRKEHPEFKEAFYNLDYEISENDRLVLSKMWTHLDGLLMSVVPVTSS